MSKIINEEILYDVVETIENNERNVVTAPELWIQDDILSWPLKGAFSKRKKPTPPGEDGWKKIPCRILAKGFKSLKAALAKERKLSQFSNTESEAEDINRRNLKRKHPIQHENLIDLNRHFNKIKSSEVKAQPVEQTSKIIFDPVVPDNIFASASVDNNYQEDDLNALMSITGYNKKNSSNPDCTITNNSVDGGHAISSTTDASHSTPPIVINCRLPAASNINSVDSTYSSQAPMVPNFYYYPPPMYANVNHFGNENTQNNMISDQRQTNGQIIPLSYTQTNVDSADNRPFTHQSLQQFSSANSLKILPPFTQHPNNLTNISPNWSQYSDPMVSIQMASTQMTNFPVSHTPMANTPVANTAIASCFQDSTVASIPMARTQMTNSHISNTAVASNSMANTPKVNILANKQIVGPRTEKDGIIKQSPLTEANGKMIRQAIGNKNCQNLKLATKKIDKMVKTKEHQTLKEKKLVKSVKKVSTEGKEKIRPQISTENSLAHGSTFNSQSIEYMKLIHKEILAMKTFNKNEAMKRKDTDKKITDVLQKLSRLETEMLQLKECNKMSAQDLILEQEQIQEFDAYFSIKNQSDLETFVFKLYKDPVYKNLLKIRLARIGGAKPQLMIRAVMKYLIHDSLLEDYCWTGTESKGSFQDLTILNTTILESIQMQHGLYTENSYNKYMKNFVNQARFRLGTESKFYKGLRGEVENDEKEKNEEEEENEKDGGYENEDEDEYNEEDEKEEEILEFEDEDEDKDE